MTLRPLIIGGSVRAEIRHVLDYAEANPIPLVEIMRIMNKGHDSAIGNDHARTMEIPIGFRVAFSIEQQPKGWVRHISVSVDGDGVAPSVIAVNAIMKEFGFTCVVRENPKLGDPDMPLTVFTEQLSGHRKLAINVLQYLEKQ